MAKRLRRTILKKGTRNGLHDETFGCRNDISLSLCVAPASAQRAGQLRESLTQTYTGVRFHEVGVPGGETRVRAVFGVPMNRANTPREAAESWLGAGALDVFDFLAFQQSFLMSESVACDCDTSTGSDVCDLFDFICFQTAFAAGCEKE